MASPPTQDLAIKHLSDYFGLERGHIGLSTHRSEWTSVFRLERDRIAPLLAPDVVEIAHVGSTSIEGISSKPVLDILVGAKDASHADNVLGKLNALGYTYKGNKLVEDCHNFTLYSGSKRLVSLVVAVHDTDGWHRPIVFRQKLLNNAGVRSAYEELKARLAQEFANSPSQYTAGKVQFVRQVAGF